MKFFIQSQNSPASQTLDQKQFQDHSIHDFLCFKPNETVKISIVICPFQNIENFMKDVYKDRYGEDISDDSVKKLYSLAVSIFAIGGMLGGFSGGIIANRFGRFVRYFYTLHFQVIR